MRSIQKTGLDEWYGLPQQVSSGSYLHVPMEEPMKDHLPLHPDCDVLIIGSQQNVSRKCMVAHSTRIRDIPVHQCPILLTLFV